ncbi:UNVERIFIED_CONTAM: hypothetical protein FKN15_043462 [Acipenser sinensis]
MVAAVGITGPADSRQERHRAVAYQDAQAEPADDQEPPEALQREQLETWRRRVERQGLPSSAKGVAAVRRADGGVTVK